MGRFKLKEKEQEKEWVVGLWEDGADVNIEVNGCTVAYFDGETGILKLFKYVKESGLPCDDRVGVIKVEVNG